MSLYDPDRLKFPVFNNPKKGHVEATWDAASGNVSYAASAAPLPAARATLHVHMMP